MLLPILMGRFRTLENYKLTEVSLMIESGLGMAEYAKTMTLSDSFALGHKWTESIVRSQHRVESQGAGFT